MFADSRYVDRLPHIRAELMLCAEYGETTSYIRLGRIVGIPTRGPWRGVLDQLSREETSAGRLDITHLLGSKRTGISSRVEFTDAHKPTIEQRRISQELRAAIWARFKKDQFRAWACVAGRRGERDARPSA